MTPPQTDAVDVISLDGNMKTQRQNIIGKTIALLLTFQLFLIGVQGNLLILAIAMYWAVSTGISQKNASLKKVSPKKQRRSVTSFFSDGLRFFLSATLALAPPLWSIWVN